MTKTVDCPNLTFSDNQRSIADGKISLNVNRRVVNLTCIVDLDYARRTGGEDGMSAESVVLATSFAVSE
jgi:hypothetical protein